MNLPNLETKFLGRNVIYFEQIESTQLYAKSLEKSKAPDGTIIIANSQTNGIGTHDRKWYTGKNDNIAMTFILYPECNLKKISNLTFKIAEIIVETIWKLYNYKLDIKNPNDIIYNSKKIGGILTESITEGEIVKKIYIGIGFNVNQITFPEDLESIASSLKKEFNRDFNKEEIMSTFFNIFEKEYLELIK